MNGRVTVYLALCGILAASLLHAREEGYEILRDRGTDSVSYLFKTKRGDVRFTHTKHKDYQKNDSCKPCHKTGKPVQGDVMRNLDSKTAHYFCKGCHKAKGKGPTECPGCHELKN